MCHVYSDRNMTWNGAQGFQTPIEPETFTVNEFGVFGNEHSERGLTCKLLDQLKIQPGTQC